MVRRLSTDLYHSISSHPIRHNAIIAYEENSIRFRGGIERFGF
jgi:hypothetical protein